MTRRMLSREFEQEAVELVTKRGVRAVQASRVLGIHASVLSRWVRAGAVDGAAAFPENGKLTPEHEELRPLRREVSMLKAARHILRKAAACFAKDQLLKQDMVEGVATTG